jgi:hypothetical protein
MGCRCLGLGWYGESSHGIALTGASSERQREVAESGGGASVQRKWRGRGFQRGLAGACGMCVWKLLGQSGLDGGERRAPRAAAHGAPERGGAERKRGQSRKCVRIMRECSPRARVRESGGEWRESLAMA